MGKILLPVTVILTILIWSQFAFADGTGKAKPGESKLLTRIDFGNSYITGQTLKSGAVYLLQRKKNKVKTMLKYRDNYRKEILEKHNLHITDKKGNKPCGRAFRLTHADFEAVD